MSTKENDLWTWSDKHSPVWENIKGSVRTVPEERKSILKLVASTTRGAGITRSSSIVVTSMTSADNLHSFLLTDMWPGLLLGGHLFHSRETQTLLDPNSKGSTHIVTKFMDYTGVRKCDIIHENDAYQCLPCNLVWMHVKMRSTLEGIQGSRSIHDLSSFYGIRPQILLLFWNNSAKWGVILSLFSFHLHVDTIGIQSQELGQIAGLSENRLWGTPPQKINKSRPDAKRQKMHF